MDHSLEYPPPIADVLTYQNSFGANVSAYFAQLRNISDRGIAVVAMPGNHGMMGVISLMMVDENCVLILL